MPRAFARRLVASTSIGSLPLAFGSILLALLAVHFGFHALEAPASQVGVGSGAAHLIYWSMILDLLGYYLLLAPAGLLLWYWLRPSGSYLSSLFSMAGLGYILVGAIGAASLAAAWPPLIHAYDTGTDAARPPVTLLFETITNLVYRGLWNSLEQLFAAVWWLGIGVMLRPERPALGVTTIVLGAACLLDAIGTLFDVAPLASIGLFVYLFLAPVWACWLGLLVARGAGPSDEALASS